ncbi:sulfite exporter TauE/SafE family protein [Aquimarina sp. U1-2]|uniref:sulfite exporter TauE/SafE family protein n=1 Tax=Aquimarina sp. U1-2 TaxID=2823141 RepID=UPI001AEC800C|nr:sulfite exporter TauE/SafE family protein [Aquimarina sp. U1-2]MBP2833790.1 sulfite exporter TauE/SafE family protein [Aquimarina sp. U1-2]
MDFSQLHIALPFVIVLASIAFMYASVGHGGASGYLALMSLFSFPIIIMKPTALLLNIFVAGISFWFFKKNEHFSWKIFYPFAITSIPAAFIGGTLSINPTLYKQILAVFLIIAILRMLNVFGKMKTTIVQPKHWLALLIGCLIGLFSGMIGIGGGIILSPVIILLGWGTMKQAAAVSALFIFVNSIAGIIGFSMTGGAVPNEAFYLIPIALIGGAAGSLFGSGRFNPKTLTYMLSVVLVIASVKLFLI